VVDGGNLRSAPYKHRHDFSEEVEFVAADGAPYQKKTQYGCSPIGSQEYPKNVHLGRALFLTKEYLADFFWAKSNKEHVYDWVLHAYGEPRPAQQGYQPSNDLEPYRWIRQVTKRRTDADWSVEWVQKYHRGEDEVGTTVTMLGAPGTTSYLGGGPMYWDDLKNSMKERPKCAHPRLPLLIARRQARDVLYAVLHESHLLKEKGQARTPARIRQYALVARTKDAIAVRVKGSGYTDYCMAAFVEDPKVTQAVAVPGVEVTRLDRSWTFATDPANEGEKAKWFAPSFNASRWKPIRVDAAWEQQGYKGYDGVGWYRLKFGAPADLEGRRVYLYFAGVDEEPRVWVNGELVGERKGAQFWDDPWNVEITKAVELGAENQLTVRVYDSSHAGGIYKDVTLVYSIEKQQPKRKAVSGPVTLTSADGKESFMFESFGYLRVKGHAVTARGRFVRFRVPARGVLTLNGKRAAARSLAGALSYGEERNDAR